jgi:hypothetical protein
VVDARNAEQESRSKAQGRIYAESHVLALWRSNQFVLYSDKATIVLSNQTKRPYSGSNDGDSANEVVETPKPSLVAVRGLRRLRIIMES